MWKWQVIHEECVAWSQVRKVLWLFQKREEEEEQQIQLPQYRAKLTHWVTPLCTSGSSIYPELSVQHFKPTQKLQGEAGSGATRPSFFNRSWNIFHSGKTALNIRNAMKSLQWQTLGHSGHRGGWNNPFNNFSLNTQGIWVQFTGTGVRIPVLPKQITCLYMF